MSDCRNISFLQNKKRRKLLKTKTIFKKKNLNYFPKVYMSLTRGTISEHFKTLRKPITRYIIKEGTNFRSIVFVCDAFYGCPLGLIFKKNE